MPRRPQGDGVIDDAEKIAASIQDTKHLLKETLDARCVEGKDLDRLLLRLSTLRELDPDESPAFLAPQPIFVPIFDGAETRPAVYDDKKARTVIRGARNGDAVADAVLCETAAVFIEGRFIMPPALRVHRQTIAFVTRAVGTARPEDTWQSSPQPCNRDRGRKIGGPRVPCNSN